MSNNTPFISIVTPTFRRPTEIAELLENLSRQSLHPAEVVLVDGAPTEEVETEKVVKQAFKSFPFQINYIRHGGGTAIQRNIGIDSAKGDFIAFIDDDVRLDQDFLKCMVEAFAADTKRGVGGIVGYRINCYAAAANSVRWRWYRRLRLLTVYEPGRYDFNCGYPINNNRQPPFTGTRAVNFMTTACAVWRREVFETGLRFDHFFCDYGMLEDAHLSLRAGQQWKLLQCGDAHCQELHSPNGRINRRKIGYKCVVNYYFVFQDIVRPLSLSHKYRFWKYQAFEFLRVGSSAIRRLRWGDAQEFWGRIEGVVGVIRGAASGKSS